MRHVLCALLAALALVPAFLRVSAQTTIVGVLEDVPGVYAGEAHSRAVRVVFQKNGGDWRPFPSNCPDQNCLRSVSSSYPLQVKWTVTFDGKNVGELTGQTPKEFGFYSHIGLQEITSRGPVPTIGKQSQEFSGFLETAVYRPLITNTQSYFADPDTWKPSALPDDLVQVVRREFRRTFPKVKNCANPDQDVARLWRYSDDNIKVTKAYSSKTKWFVAQVLLAGYGCDGPPDDPFIDQWFAISPAGKVKFLDAGMWLVDAGDYDNDGKSELVFSIDRYNRGGYELFYADFEKKSRFEYSYH